MILNYDLVVAEVLLAQIGISILIHVDLQLQQDGS